MHARAHVHGDPGLKPSVSGSCPDAIIRKAQFADKIAWKHGVSTDEVEEVLTSRPYARRVDGSRPEPRPLPWPRRFQLPRSFLQGRGSGSGICPGYSETISPHRGMDCPWYGLPISTNGCSHDFLTIGQ